MKVLDVSEVISEIDRIVTNKENDDGKLESTYNAVQDVINLDHALKGETGNAIKEHLNTLHVPILILFRQFITQYISDLKNVQSRIEAFESSNGYINQSFIETSVKPSLTRLKSVTRSIVDDINTEYWNVTDLVAPGSINPSMFEDSVENARNYANETIEGLVDLDKSVNSLIQENEDSLNELNTFIQKLQNWTADGIHLSEQEIEELADFLVESDIIQKMVEKAEEISLNQEDSTFQGEIAEWLDKLGKFHDKLEFAHAAIGVTILATKMLDLEEISNGNYRVVASDRWKQVDGKYGSILAEKIYKLMKKKNKPQWIEALLSKYNNTPSGILRELIGLAPGTTRISFGRLVSDNVTELIEFDEKLLKENKLRVDVDKTKKNLSKNVTKTIRKVPVIGWTISIASNSGEFISDENANLSNFEKGGRFAGGLALDASTGGFATGGAVIGSLIAPGPGTIIGGLIGTGVGIWVSWEIEDTVKDIGEKIGGFVEDIIENISEGVSDFIDWVDEGLSNVGKFFSGIFN